jgi:hypothetical protein
MEQVLSDYSNRPWPKKTINKNSRASTLERRHRCKADCDCTSYAQCQQNAAAYLAASQYMDAFKPSYIKPSKLIGRATGRCHSDIDDIKCAAKNAKHRVGFFSCF